jgi:hypothetical protein
MLDGNTTACSGQSKRKDNGVYPRSIRREANLVDTAGRTLGALSYRGNDTSVALRFEAPCSSPWIVKNRFESCNAQAEFCVVPGGTAYIETVGPMRTYFRITRSVPIVPEELGRDTGSEVDA